MEVVGLDPDHHIIYLFFWGERDSYLPLPTTDNKGTIDKLGNVYCKREEGEEHGSKEETHGKTRSCERGLKVPTVAWDETRVQE